MKTILLADDDVHLSELVQTTLEDPDYRILEVNDGERALELARTAAPDLIILDWMMPGMTGIDVARRLAAEDGAPPIIMLTAKGQERDLELSRAAGAKYHLVKPFSPLELLERVREVLT